MNFRDPSGKNGRRLATVMALLLLLLLCGCAGAPSDGGGEKEPSATAEETAAAEDSEKENDMAERLKMSIDGEDIAVAWEDNESVEALKGLVSDGPLTVEMTMYGGFEQVGPLGTSLPSSDTHIRAKAGDIFLYNSDHIVVFHDSNSWDYTPLGKITDKTPEELKDILGSRNITITLSLQ